MCSCTTAKCAGCTCGCFHTPATRRSYWQGVHAAREAVAALTAGRERMDYEDGPEVYGAHNAYIDCVDDALAAIDALREETK